MNLLATNVPLEKPCLIAATVNAAQSDAIPDIPAKSKLFTEQTTIMRRLIPDSIPTEEIYGNTVVGIPSAHRVRPQGILSFTIEQHQEVSIIFNKKFENLCFQYDITLV